MERTDQEYMIMSSNTITNLEEEVNSKIEEYNYKPLGSPFIIDYDKTRFKSIDGEIGDTGIIYYQALIKKE